VRENVILGYAGTVHSVQVITIGTSTQPGMSWTILSDRANRIRPSTDKRPRRRRQPSLNSGSIAGRVRSVSTKSPEAQRLKFAVPGRLSALMKTPFVLP
jgi:hypothetical protein